MQTPLTPADGDASQESELQFRAIFEQAAAGLVRTTPDGRILEANEGFATLVGRPRMQLKGMAIRDLGFAEDWDLEQEQVANAWSRSDKAFHLEKRYRRPDGSTAWADVSIFQIHDPSGKVSSLVGMAVNITDRKRAEEAVRYNRSLLAIIINTLPQAVFWKDRHLVYFGCNERFAQDIGISSPGEIVGKTDYDLPWPRTEADAYRRDDQEVITHQRPKTRIIEPLQRADGARLWIETNKVPLFDARGEVFGLLGIYEDITERRRAEEELRQAHQRERLHFEQTPLAVIEWDVQFRVTRWNPGAERVFGYKAAEALGQHATFIVPPEMLPEMEQVWPQLLSGSGGSRTTTENLHRDGRRIFCEWYNTPLVNEEGRTIAVASLVMDITERRVLEEHLRQSQKLESIGQLAAGVAHDFNNILMVITGNAAMLLNEMAPGTTETDLLREILAASERAANLTRQLLLFSRKQRMQPKPVDLNQLIANLTKLLRRTLREDIALEFNHQAHLPPLNADPGMIEQVILNLAVNARDAMPQGGRLQIATSATEVGPGQLANHPEANIGPHVCLAVTDTGTGIPLEIRDRIFEPFFTTKEVGKGTGLGLATVYGIVKQHGGWIELDSTVGEGTTFRIYFPASQQAPSSLQKQGPGKQLRGQGQTVLVVEDESSVRELVCRILRLNGYHVLAAASGADALQLNKNELTRVELLLTDMVMPGGVSGRELAETLRRDYPRLRVIYYSGYSADVTDTRMNLGEDVVFLQKPFSPQELLRAIDQLLRA